MINYFLPTKSATVETLGHPAAGVVGWIDQSTNPAGVAVTENSALTLSAVWCATRVIAETVGALPCMMYRKKSDNERERADDDKRYALVHDSPHPAMSAGTFFETQTAHMVLRGNCYSRINFNLERQPSQLLIRLPGSVTTEAVNDSMRYRISDPNEVLSDRNCLHVKGLGGDGLTGWSVVKYAQQSMGGGLAGDQYAASVFGNKATPSGVLSHPSRLDKDAREQLRREWEDMHRGSSNAARIAIMHGGMEFSPISMTNEDAQFLQSRQFSVREVARWFRLPPHMLADLADSSVRANIEQQALEFIQYSMMPWFKRWERELNRKLLTEDERKTLYFEFNYQALLQGDSAAQSQAWSIGRQWGWYSINDIRKFMNMPPVEGGDVHLQPMNMQDVAGEDEQPPAMPVTPPVPQQEDQGEDDQEEVPQSLRGELQANLLESLNAIIDSGKQLHVDLTAGHATLEQGVTVASARADEAVRGLHALREEIKRDIESVGRTVQVHGWQTEKERLRAACTELLQSNLLRTLKVEKASVSKAAVMADSRGLNFCKWLDEFYGKHQAIVEDRISGPIKCYNSIDHEQESHSALAEWLCGYHREQLLNACDGEKDGFVDRVQTVLDGWDEHIQAITLGVCEHVS